MTASGSRIFSEEDTAIRASIGAASSLSKGYLLMNSLAATIASYGLLANSASVVIGAMIVAMLLGPISGVALALVEGDTRLLRQGLGTLAAGVAVVMLTGFVIGLVHRDIPITTEMLSRTAPNLIDLMVALASGAAGIYAAISPRLSVALVGVAIATALVPPLCTACLLLSRGAVDHALGALLLALTNMVAIQFAASLVFWLSGFGQLPTRSGGSWVSFVRSNALSLVVLGLLAVVLSNSLHQLVEGELYESATRSVLQATINNRPGCYLVDVRFDRTQPGKTLVRAVIRGPTPPTGAQVAALENQLPRPPELGAVELRIRFVKTLSIDRHGLRRLDMDLGMLKPDE